MATSLGRLNRRFEKAVEIEAKNAQREARREELASKARQAQRAADIRLEKELGRIARRGALGKCEWDEIRGALYSQEEGASDPKVRAAWRRKAAERDAAEAAERDRVREPLVITFRQLPAGATLGALRSAGFRLNRLFGRWEGNACLEEAMVIVRGPYEGTVHRVASDNLLVPVGWDKVETESDAEVAQAAE